MNQVKFKDSAMEVWYQPKTQLFSIITWDTEDKNNRLKCEVTKQFLIDLLKDKED